MRYDDRLMRKGNSSMKEKIDHTIDTLKKHINGYFSDISGVASEVAKYLKEHKKPVLTRKQKISSGGTVVAALAVAALIAVPAFTADASADDELSTADAETVTSTEEQESESVVEKGQFFIISVDGADIALLDSEETATAALEAVKAKFVTEGAELVSAEFKENVEIRSAELTLDADGNPDVSISLFEDADAAASYIVSGCAEQKTYTVQGGDTLWDIAASNGISVYELQEMNPEYAEGNLSIGTVLNLYEMHPFVTVAVTEKVTETESIPYETTYENTDSLYKGQSSVKSAGVKGSKDVTTEYVKENNTVISSTVVAENVTAEPVNQVSYVGTATVQVQTGSGRLSAPLSTLKVNSSFGASRGGGTRSHAGVDFGGTNGQAIMAADSGTVIFSGWGQGSLGYTVKIDHGNGLTTVYAHCSALYVSYGQNVSKGEVIAAVGKTGNATGYLLHFEVRQNGVAKNPMNYL